MGIALVSSLVSAEPGLGAREQFARGVALAEQGELDAAAAAFEQAYRISPNYAVLYNLGEAYVALGKPVEAISTLQKYLELGGDKVGVARRREVADLIAFNKKRLGSASLRIDRAGAEISVDGHSVGKSPLSEPVALVVGTHSVTAQVEECLPYIGHIEIVAGKTAELDISLLPLAAPARERGLLVVESSTTATEVQADEEPVVGESPAVFSLPTGSHSVTCKRRGYVPFEGHVEVREGAPARVTCHLFARSDLPAGDAGTLSVIVNEPRAEVRVDERSASTTLRLPVGPHHVEVRLTGFEGWEQTTTLEPGQLRVLSARLHPTREHAAEIDRLARSRRNWAYGYGATGLSLLGASAAIYLNNNNRYAVWESDRDALTRELESQTLTPTLNTRSRDLQQRAASIQGQDDLAVGLGVLGGALVALAIDSWLTSK